VAHIPAERCLEIIELLAEGAREMPLREVADRLRLPKSGAHRLLATLVELGWAVQDPGTGFYRLTMHLAVLGQKFYIASGVADICQPLLDRLAADCREFARLAVFDGNALVWIAHAQGATSGVGLVYQPTETTGTVPLFATASGKAWLATLTAENAAQHVLKDGGFEHAHRYGPNVIRTIEALLRELHVTAERGYGLAVDEAEPGVTAIGAAIRAGPNGAGVGTVSIAGPTVRMDESRVRELAPRVVKCAAEMSLLWPLRPRSPQSFDGQETGPVDAGPRDAHVPLGRPAPERQAH
jgi:IclR family acetate operon transcriptional repressor